jgi:hypothetical protein
MHCASLASAKKGGQILQVHCALCIACIRIKSGQILLVNYLWKCDE